MRLRIMTPDDVSLGMRLGMQNGWNQLEGDWLRFLSMQPDGCFLAEMDGRGVGTACACIFDSVAWVALVLVDSACRNQGIGTALMTHVLHFLRDKNVPTIRLDATPLGRPIYERLGFVADYELTRYEGVLPQAQPPTTVNAAQSEDVEAICRLDRDISGADRSKFLRLLYREDPAAMTVVRGSAELRGYACSRPGARATQIGPCIADAEAGSDLLGNAFARHRGMRVYVDIPLQNQHATRLARTAGLSVQRNLLRMTLGKRLDEKIDWIWASSGPEKG